MPRKIVVAQRLEGINADIVNRDEAVKDALRTLRPLGVRFSVTEVDGEGVTIAAWLAEPVVRTPRASRRALGAGVSTPELVRTPQTDVAEDR